MRKEFARVGMQCWVVDVTCYPLPEGLPDRSAVTVVECGGWNNVVRDQHGKDWNIWLVNLDTRYTLVLDGETVLESHPKFAAYLRHSLVKLSTVNERLLDPEERISSTRWLLERNGYDPDGSMPEGPCPVLGAHAKSPAGPSLRGPQTDSPRRMRS